MRADVTSHHHMTFNWTSAEDTPFTGCAQTPRDVRSCIRQFLMKIAKVGSIFVSKKDGNLFYNKVILRMYHFEYLCIVYSVNVVSKNLKIVEVLLVQL